MAVNAWEFTVEGSGSFPFDMLRYDQCWPKSESPDSATLELMTRRARGPFSLTLVGLSAPTQGRWESFGWRVISQSERRI